PQDFRLHRHRPNRPPCLAYLRTNRGGDGALITDHQKRLTQLDEIFEFYGLTEEEDRVLREQIKSLTNLGVDVLHTLMKRGRKPTGKPNNVASFESHKKRSEA